MPSPPSLGPSRLLALSSPLAFSYPRSHAGSYSLGTRLVRSKNSWRQTFKHGELVGILHPTAFTIHVCMYTCLIDLYSTSHTNTCTHSHTDIPDPLYSATLGTTVGAITGGAEEYQTREGSKLSLLSWLICIRLNRAHPKFLRGLAIWLHLGLSVVSKASKFEALSLFSAAGRGYFTERNGTLENTEQLCKSSLQCLISTNCTPMDRARRVLHAGNHIDGT